MSDGAKIGRLVWGVKQSFRGYVEASGGTITVGGGAERTADGAFAFGPGEGDLTVGPDGAPAGTGGFAGEVKFEAHGGMLSVFLADPQVTVAGGEASLSVADSAARGRRVTIVKLDLAAATRDGGALVLPAVTTLDGMFLLGDHYPPGTPVDPVRLEG